MENSVETGFWNKSPGGAVSGPNDCSLPTTLKRGRGTKESRHVRNNEGCTDMNGISTGCRINSLLVFCNYLPHKAHVGQSDCGS